MEVSMSLIQLIDDDQQLCTSFAKILDQEGYAVVCAYSGREGINAVTSRLPDLVILDIRLPDMHGLEVFEEIHALAPKLPVIIITAHGSTETTIGAIQKGAYDYIYKPFDVAAMLELIAKALVAGRCMSTPVAMNPDIEDIGTKDALVGHSAKMLEVYKAIGRVSPTDATVLIRGESGTGKELVARAIYNHSQRADKPFVVVNCVAIPETLLESELFGYEKGTFTGATHRRIGKIEQARGGTVFLDEIGDMPLAIQAKFLRLLQENSIERLGGKDPISVDVRIIGATNRDLEKAVAEGQFREDLYYRLRVVTLALPPLRERREDLQLLTEYLLSKLSVELKISNPGIDAATLEKIYNYDWPGNIRQLSNKLQKALIFNRGAPLQPEDVAIVGEKPQPLAGEIQEDCGERLRLLLREVVGSGERPRLFDSCLDQVACILVQEALALSRGNRSQAAKLLGISRPTLHAKIDKYNLKESDGVGDE
jgi:DNA-binding NtrC family response regulator